MNIKEVHIDLNQYRGDLPTTVVGYPDLSAVTQVGPVKHVKSSEHPNGHHKKHHKGHK